MSDEINVACPCCGKMVGKAAPGSKMKTVCPRCNASVALEVKADEVNIKFIPKDKKAS